MIVDPVTTGEQFAFVYYERDGTACELRVRELVARGATITSASIAYGPSPARIAGLRSAEAGTWHVLIVGRWAPGAPYDAEPQ